MGGGNYMANTKDAYVKWKEQGLLRCKTKKSSLTIIHIKKQEV